MAILVDDAAWAWRGERWAHLISDRSYDELHTFANGLGVRRLGFQDDHYDITTATREVAVARGARAVSSRAVIGALRSSGLRARGARRRWVEVATDEPDALGAAAYLSAAWPQLGGVVWSTALRRPGEVALSATLAAGALAEAAIPTALERVVYVVDRLDEVIVDAVLTVPVP